MLREFTSGRALIVGVSRYRHMRDLPEVAHDAMDVRALLRDPLRAGYPQHQVRSLLDEEATRPAVLAALGRLAGEAQPQDTVVVYLSGHGGRIGTEPGAAGYFLTVEAEPDRLPETAIAAGELTEAFHAIHAARLVVIIDACHAGSTGDLMAEASRPIAGLTDDGLNGLASGIGRAVIASCRPDEVSWIEPDARNSLFTGHLLDALRGELHSTDGYLRVVDLFLFVARRVRAARPGQCPILKLAMEDNFAVALSSGVTAAVEAPAASPARSMPGPLVGSDAGDGWWRELLSACARHYPDGPIQDDLWERAGGDRSRLPTRGNGRSAWRAALGDLRKGGGGAGISPPTLLSEMKEDYPNDPDLARLEAASEAISG